MSHGKRLAIESYRRLAALTELHSGEKVTQRSLAARLGISLGLANGLLRDLEARGFIAVNRFAGSTAARYVLTRKGRAELMRLAVACADDADAMLAPIRAEMHRRIGRMKAAGRRRALLFGDGQLIDMAASALLAAGIGVAGILDAMHTGGRKSLSKSEMHEMRYDVAVALTRRDADRLRQCLGRRVPVVQLLGNVVSKEQVRGR